VNQGRIVNRRRLMLSTHPVSGGCAFVRVDAMACDFRRGGDSFAAMRRVESLMHNEDRMYPGEGAA
jgi:hypothetical protein